MPTKAERISTLRETVALQRFHARHGFAGLPSTDLTKLRSMRSYSPTTESIEFLLSEAIKIWYELNEHWATDPQGLKMLARERGVHNVPKLLNLLG